MKNPDDEPQEEQPTVEPTNGATGTPQQQIPMFAVVGPALETAIKILSSLPFEQVEHLVPVLRSSQPIK